MAPPRRESQRSAEKPKAQSHHATPPVCTPCYVRLERCPCPDTDTTGRCFVQGGSGSGPLPATWRIPYRKDPVIIDVWSLHPNASWRRKTAKTYERYHNQSDNERLNRASDGNQGGRSDHPDPKHIEITDVKVCKNYTDLLQEGILMRGEIEKRDVAKRATKVAELKQNITSMPSQSTNYITIKTESDVQEGILMRGEIEKRDVAKRATKVAELKQNITSMPSQSTNYITIKTESDVQEGILMRGEIEKRDVAKRATKVADLKQNITSMPSQSTNYITIKTECDVQEGILMRGEIEKRDVAKRATKVAELKQNITSLPSQSTNYIMIKTESDVRQLILEEHRLRLSHECVFSDQRARTVSQGLALCPVSESQIKSEPTNEQLSIVDQQTFETSHVYTELRQLGCEERVEEDSKIFHTYTNSVEGDSLQKAVVDNKGDALLLSHIQGEKAFVHVRRPVKSHRAKKKRSRKIKVDRDDEANCCRFCSKSFSGKHYLRKHQEKMVCFTALSCKTCGKKFANKMGMYQHSKTHTQVKPYSCGHCIRRFRWVSQLNVHLVEHIKDNSLIKNVCCSSCEWVTLPGALAIMELRRKTSHICKTCGKGFQLRMDGERFQCQECNGVFATMASLSGHRRSHKKTIFQCADCVEHFESVYLLQKHSEKDHPLERPYVCKQCGERFPRKSVLETHLLAHEDQWSIPPASPNRMNDVEEEGDIDYICKQCGEKFPRKSGLETHLLAHEDQWSIPPASPNRMNDVEEEGDIEQLIDSLSNDNELLAPVTDSELLEPVMLNPVKEEPCTFSILEPYQIKTESEEMPCYPFNSIKVERDDAFW